MPAPPDILDLVSQTKARGEPFALATVVRTIAVTAAKAGAKALILADGQISGGWIGGGCARAAVLKAARDALADGQSRLVSIQPDDLLREQQISAGETHAGVVYAKNMCPSQGTMDIFVEPILPRPHLILCGASPVAVALADLSRRMGFFVTLCAPEADHSAFGEVDRLIDGFRPPVDNFGLPFVVVATQGRGDSAALSALIHVQARYFGFVGSRKKAAALKAALAGGGAPAAQLETIRAPAGLDIGAISPDEIALSIVAEMLQALRRGQRQGATLSD